MAIRSRISPLPQTYVSAKYKYLLPQTHFSKQMRGPLHRRNIRSTIQSSPDASVSNSLTMDHGMVSIFVWTTRGIKYSDVWTEYALLVDLDWIGRSLSVSCFQHTNVTMTQSGQVKKPEKTGNENRDKLRQGRTYSERIHVSP